MKRTTRILLSILVLAVTSLWLTMPTAAVPQLPSSFYGKVKVNNASVADGTSIQALVGGSVVAEGITLTYQGESVYAVDVPGDDSETPAKDGGMEGDTVQFKIGGLPAGQTGVWHSGTNVALDLSATGSEPISTPEPTRTPRPTQTPLDTPAPTRTATLPEPWPTDTITAVSSTQSPAPTMNTAATIPTQASAAGGGQSGSNNNTSGSSAGAAKNDNATRIALGGVIGMTALITGVLVMIQRGKAKRAGK